MRRGPGGLGRAQGVVALLATAEKTTLITPYGGTLVDLMVPEGERAELRAYANTLPSVRISERAVCDLELLATGAFSPLDRFMGQADHQSVLDTMRLTNGYLFPMPIPLPVDEDTAAQFKIGQDVALRSPANELLAIMNVEEMYEWDLEEVAQKAFGTLDLRHPIVAEMHNWGKYNLSGPMRVLQLPTHYDFKSLRFTPRQTRAMLEGFGHHNVIAFQTRNPLHRVHEELTKRATQEKDGVLLLHPVVGMTKPGDVDHFTRVRTYKALAQRYYDPDRILLSLLPLAMRMGGPREALWHAIIRRNHGANHLIVGRDHAGPGNDSNGKPFYGPYDAQQMVEQYEEELGVTAVPFQMLVYLPDEDRYEEVTKVAKETKTASISGTQVREQYLQNGKQLPEWFTRPEVAEILAETYPPRYRQGVCVWFTGLHNAGKSTTAGVLTTLLQEFGRNVTLLDGDVVRTHFSEGLGFSKEDRDDHVRRIGFVASEIVRHGGIVVAAAASPYRATRNEVRNTIGQENYIEVYVDTPLEICEQRDTKGLYARARRGEIVGFTGIDDPYEAPQHPEITIETLSHTPEDNARMVLNMLIEQGFVRTEAPGLRDN
ncbi:bifunctional sulfate adenylyltransferase/adenylylsulfate kinase [Promineifilum sp.]|uniref:bifunctional sulfate adenylyltransferase/adenylylsulfate kinase n=1 Tax=Promineifilum sp. TaxID=2664178 RepID=UPI0035AF870B